MQDMCSDHPRGPMAQRPLAVHWLGRIDYDEAWALQKALVKARVDGAIEDVLLLLEHPPTITHSFTGRGLENLLGGEEQLQKRGVVVRTTDRGGDITFHGPGQLVGYPIVQLDAERGERDLHLYLRKVESMLISLSAGFGLETTRVVGRTGTWLPDGSLKLAAIGVKVSRWVTQHGFAINHSTDLSYFQLIVPCGIGDAGVTSMEAQLGSNTPPLDVVVERVGACFAQEFDRRLSPPSQSLRILLPR
ncbi:MAG: lipoyl(octanoyl) transferase [Deltaproteobacteria bacterium]|nr:lipoyl(octanoyl) transferase [Deltaproteobacteria bacterium]